MSLPAYRISPAVGVRSRTTHLPIVVLPDPDSPTRPSVVPGVEREAHIVHCLEDVHRAAQQPVPRREVHAQVAHLEEGPVVGHASAWRWQLVVWSAPVDDGGGITVLQISIAEGQRG